MSASCVSPQARMQCSLRHELSSAQPLNSVVMTSTDKQVWRRRVRTCSCVLRAKGRSTARQLLQQPIADCCMTACSALWASGEWKLTAHLIYKQYPEGCPAGRRLRSRHAAEVPVTRAVRCSNKHAHEALVYLGMARTTVDGCCDHCRGLSGRSSESEHPELSSTGLTVSHAHSFSGT